MQLPLAEHLQTLTHGILWTCAFTTDTAGRPIMLKSVYDPEVWQFGGGNVDQGEHPWESTVREVREETGHTLRGEPRLLAVIFQAPAGDWPAKVGVAFDGGLLTADQIDALVLDPAEHSEVRVQALDDWRRTLTPARFAMVAALATARRTGFAQYLHS
ncbi:NUDIX domain-containing protein [Kitasatospora sp. NPDC096147]|uniref:NUDIX domain-containing protein n=1 Tax=Kitasatospora sp. NPDC096147 TaxID=3364093 RepID=UPI003812E23C